MKATTLFLFLGLLLTGPAHAAVNANSCKADADKFCPGVKPGGGAIRTCLKKHESSLTPDCAQFLQEAGIKMKNFTKACAGDVKKSCSGVQPGEGRILACLKKNEATLSADCKNQMKPSAR